MHPATPLIPAIWSSSKHARDVKIPHLDVGEQQAPESKWMGWGEWRRVENGGVWHGVLKEEKEEVRRHKVAVGVGSGMCHTHIPAALLLINFSHDQLWSQIHKTWEGGRNACTPYHPRCHSTPLPCYREMSIAFLICLLLPSWPLLYAFDEGLPKMCPFVPLWFVLQQQTECGSETLHLLSHPGCYLVIYKERTFKNSYRQLWPFCSCTASLTWYHHIDQGHPAPQMFESI